MNAPTVWHEFKDKKDKNKNKNKKWSANLGATAALWLIMERLLNWPDLRSPISKLRDIHFIDTVTDINR